MVPSCPAATLKTASPIAKVEPRESQRNQVSTRSHCPCPTRWPLVPLRKQAGLSEFDSLCSVFHAEQVLLVSGPLCGLQCASLVHSSRHEQKSTPLLLRLMQVKLVPRAHSPTTACMRWGYGRAHLCPGALYLNQGLLCMRDKTILDRRADEGT